MRTQASLRQIREFLGHKKGNRKVVVRKTGKVLYYGSTNDIDRSHDYWHDGGYSEYYLVDEDGKVYAT
jgi:hypothetical protein